MSWLPVANVDECKPGQAHIVEVGGKEIGIFCEDGVYYAVLNHCPHSGAPVCRGRVFGRVVCDAENRVTYDSEAKTLRCPWHHWEFDLASGKPLLPIRERLKVYPVQVNEETVYIQLSGPKKSPADDLPASRGGAS